MGRQSYLVRLALGRSPFQDPERDEDGDFILGPHAHDLDNHDHYVQDFEERGHPRNKATVATTRELRRAQNDVLETMGIVIKKSEAAKTVWQRSTKEQKIETIVNENQLGLILLFLDSSVLIGFEWWVTSLRRRIQTYYSYSTIPLWQIIRSELRIVGPLTFCTVGMLTFGIVLFEPWLESSLTVMARFSAPAREDEDAASEESICHCLVCSSRDAILSFISSSVFTPPYVFSMLQLLHLIPASTLLPWQSFLPWSHMSPTNSLVFPTVLSTSGLLSFCQSLMIHPVILKYITEQVRKRLEKRIFRVLVCTVDMPDSPDDMSQKVAFDINHESSDKHGVELRKRSVKLRGHRTRSLFTEVRYQFSWIDNVLDMFSSWFSRKDSTVFTSVENMLHPRDQDSEEATTAMPTTHSFRERGMSRAFALGENALEEEPNRETDNSDPPNVPLPPSPLPEPASSSEDAVSLHENAIDNPGIDHSPTALANTVQNPSRPGLTRPSHSVPPFASSESINGVTASAILLPNPDASRTTTSVDGANIEPVSDRQEIVLIGTSETNEQEHRDESEDSASQVFRTRPTRFRSRTSTASPDRSEDLEEPRLARARPIWWERPLHHLTSRDESLDRSGMWTRRTKHRITALSIYPAYSLAEHASSLIATAILLPLESFALRALVLNFLSHPADRPGAAVAALGLRADVRPLFGWFGGGADGTQGRLNYVRLLLLTLGLQGVVSVVNWKIVTSVVVWMGKQYGWGQI